MARESSSASESSATSDGKDVLPADATEQDRFRRTRQGSLASRKKQIHPDVGGYLALMTGINLNYAPASRASTAQSLDTTESDEAIMTRQVHVPVDPVTKAYIRDMTGVILQYSSDSGRNPEERFDARTPSNHSDENQSQGSFRSRFSPLSVLGSSPSSSRSRSPSVTTPRNDIFIEDPDHLLPTDGRLALATGRSIESVESSPAPIDIYRGPDGSRHRDQDPFFTIERRLALDASPLSDSNDSSLPSLDVYSGPDGGRDHSVEGFAIYQDSDASEEQADRHLFASPVDREPRADRSADAIDGDPILPEIRTALLAEHAIQSPQSFRARFESDNEASRYDSQDGRDYDGYAIYENSDYSSEHADRHLFASPADREDRVGRDVDARDEDVLQSIESGYDGDIDDVYSGPGSSSDKYPEFDSRTQRYFQEMTGIDSYKLQELWRDGTPPHIKDSQESSSNKENEDPAPASTPTGLARVDRITREFLRQMTGTAPLFVSVERQIRSPSSRHETTERTQSPANGTEVNESKIRRLDRATVQLSPIADTHDNGKRQRSSTSGTESPSPKRLRTDRVSPDNILSSEASHSSSALEGSTDRHPANDPKNGTTKSPRDFVRPERDRSVVRD
ncbi:hypothetical protein [Rhizobium sp. NFACC06-2]|uniref:hypothetical protein n=1 Tax=Rhizobium sp. NFACC06-2 TaxID=1566264 RepID=UPI000876A4A0|nr:hypothetical protein [Rhizobium sp. NFACC06-2]SCY90606.1 hypothetical protein SAMN03159288_05120 [Rhizobium sp. NFACC06-2]